MHSKFGLDKLLEQAPQLGEKSTIIPLGNYNAFKEKVSAQISIDTNRIKSDLGFSPEEKLLLIFGTIKPNKRLDWVIQALPLVIASHLDTRLLIVGKPQDREITADQNLASELGVEEQINWRTNRVSDEELAQYFSIADIFNFSL